MRLKPRLVRVPPAGSLVVATGTIGTMYLHPRTKRLYLVPPKKRRRVK